MMDGETPKLSVQLTTHGERLEVRATARQGEACVEVASPPAALYDAVAQLDQAAVFGPTLQSAGKQLYECLTAGDAGKLTTAVFHDASALHQPVHLELRFDPGQTGLARLPWELLVDDYGRTLVLDGLANVTRYITYPQAPPSLEPTFDSDPLLRVVARPRGLPELAISDLPVTNILMLDHASFDMLERKLLIERVAIWGMHFDGHGSTILVCECGAINDPALLGDRQAKCCQCHCVLAPRARLTGGLIFEHNGGPHFVTTEQVGAVLYNSRACLALLLACESARVGGQTLFSGLAPGLLLAGVPAVIGMQYPVSDEFANRFARNFYSALLGERDILAAMHTARRLTREGAWYSPALYLRQHSPKSTAEPIYRTRHIDTAAPAQMPAGGPFLARLWIRRPETPQLTEPELRRELGVAPSAPLSARSATADVRFEPVSGRELRRGEVQVELAASGCSVEPKTIKLFVDEHLDAPAAIFTVRPPGQSCSVVLQFAVFQDGGLIVSANHLVEVVETGRVSGSAVSTNSCAVRVQDSVPDLIAVLNPSAPRISGGSPGRGDLGAVADPITRIVTALAAGAAAAARPGTSQAITDAYVSLKDLITRKYAKAAPAVDQLEAAPASKARHAVVEEDLGETDAARDPELLQQALALLDEILPQTERLVTCISVERFQAKPRAGSDTAVVVMEQTGAALRHYCTLLPGQDALSIGERMWGKFMCYVVDMGQRELHIDESFLTYDRVASVRVQADVVYQVVDAERVAIRVEDALRSLNTELRALLEREIVRLPLEQVTAEPLEGYLKRESPRLEGKLGIAVERARIRVEWDEKLLAQRAEDAMRRRDQKLEDEQRRRQERLEMEDVAHIDALIRNLGLEGLPADFRLRLVALPRKEALAQIISLIEQQRALGALSRLGERELELLKQMISDGTLEPMDKVEFGKRLMDLYQNMMAFEDWLGMSPTVSPRNAQEPQIEASRNSLMIATPLRLEFVRVPAGEFLMGSDPAHDRDTGADEQPQHRVYLDEFFIGKYLVTNAQYAVFLEMTQQRAPRHWSGEEFPAGLEQHPVVGVSWYDAMAFCRWLATVSGSKIGLPTEAEWEKAARGTDGRIYPWGNRPPNETRCNYGENIGDTTPVGRYSAGASPYGVLDMAGNVWEWMNSLYKPYPYRADDGREGPETGPRVLRGGSCGNGARDVRCAARGREFPLVGNWNIGFRVVASTILHDSGN